MAVVNKQPESELEARVNKQTTSLQSQVNNLVAQNRKLQAQMTHPAALTGLSRTVSSMGVDIDTLAAQLAALPTLYQKLLTVQFDATTTITLTNVTDLEIALTTGPYYFELTLFLAPDGAGGYNVVIDTDTITEDLLIFEVQVVDFTTPPGTIVSWDKKTALPGGVTAIGGTDLTVKMYGTINVTAAGAFKVQFAQNFASGTSSILIGSYLSIMEIV